MNAKRVTKRVIAVVLTMMLALTCFILPTAINANAADETIVNIHYYREDGSYGDWDVWAWADGLDGAGYAFTDNGDADGAVATITITEATPSLGFIVRKPDWSAKDPDGDRKVDLSSVVSGTVDVYCKAGSELDDFTVNFDNAVFGLKIRTAKAVSKTSVDFTLTMTPADDDSISVEDFNIISAGGQSLTLDTVTMTSPTGGELALAEELDYTKEYTIYFRETSMKLSLPDYFSSAEFEDAYTYTGDDLGATVTAGGTNFRVWAPTAQKVELNIYAAGDGGTAEQVVEMQAAEKGTWFAAANGNLSGKYYTYTAYFDGKVNQDIVDPYAKSVGVNGKRGMVLDMSSTDPDGWNSDSRRTYENVTDMEIYELHIRDFSIGETNGIQNKGKYLAFTERGTKDESGVATGVDHLVDLGVTSIHILPSYDYGSVDETKLDKAQFNWGYDPVNYNAPEGSYSTDSYHGEVRVNEYKQMVKGLHDAGLGVIMDVVYNHTYNTQYCFNQLVPDYFYRPNQNTSGCGNDVASERSMVRKFIVDSVKYWASEYHLDGFRFDLMGILDVETMNAVRAAVDEVDPSIIIYGEGWNMGCVATKSDTLFANYTNAALTPRIGYFSDTIRDTLKGSVFDAEEKGYINGESKHYKALINSIVPYTRKWSPSPDQTINYADCHDNLTLWDKIRSSNGDDSEADQIRQNNLAAAIIQTSQGVPFMMSGEEFLRTKTKKDGTFDHNSYASPDYVNVLDYSRIAAYPDVYNYYKGLIAFRKAHPAFRMMTAADVDANYVSALDNVEKGVAAFTLKGGANGETAEEIMVVYNPFTEDTNVTLPAGNWDIYVNDAAAGNTVLGTVSDQVSVPRISAMVLVKGYKAPEQSDPSQTSETSEPSQTSETSEPSQTSETSEPEYYESQRTDYVYFDNSQTKWDKVYAYWWNSDFTKVLDKLTGKDYPEFYTEDGAGQAFDKWYPGQEMTQIEGTDIWQARVPYGATKFIFNSGVKDEDVRNGVEAFQTIDLDFSDETNAGQIYVIDVNGELKPGRGIEKTKFRYQAGEWKDYEGVYMVETFGEKPVDPSEIIEEPSKTESEDEGSKLDPTPGASTPSTPSTPGTSTPATGDSTMPIAIAAVAVAAMGIVLVGSKKKAKN